MFSVQSNGKFMKLTRKQNEKLHLKKMFTKIEKKLQTKEINRAREINKQLFVPSTIETVEPAIFSIIKKQIVLTQEKSPIYL